MRLSAIGSKTKAIQGTRTYIAPETLKKAWRDLLDETDGTTLMVTSNGVARFVLDIVSHAGVARKLKTGAYGIVEGSGDDWRIRDWNIRPR